MIWSYSQFMTPSPIGLPSAPQTCPTSSCLWPWNLQFPPSGMFSSLCVSSPNTLAWLAPSVIPVSVHITLYPYHAPKIATQSLSLYYLIRALECSRNHLGYLALIPVKPAGMHSKPQSSLAPHSSVSLL